MSNISTVCMTVASLMTIFNSALTCHHAPSRIWRIVGVSGLLLGLAGLGVVAWALAI
jgi:type IV secretory pathway TrbF-like protein